MRAPTSKLVRAARRRAVLARLLADSQAGFTIIEVVVSAVIVASIAGAAATALIATNNLSGDQRFRSQAATIAQQDQERLRGMSISQLSGRNETRNVGPYNGTTYTVTSTGKFISATGASSCASSGAGAAAYVLIRSEVDWVANDRSTVVEESLITPRTGGALITNVIDQTGAGLPGVTVTAVGPETQAALTSNEGCTVFGSMASGDYTVEVEKSGYVDPEGNLSPSVPVRPAIVSGTGTSFPTPNPFRLGQAGAIQASFTANNGGLTNQHAPSLSVSHPDRPTPVLVTPGSPTGPITTPTNLFPFTDPYTVWPGSCPGQMPPDGANRTTMTVGPGALVTTPAVREPGLRIRVYYPTFDSAQPDLNRVKPIQVKLTYNQTVGGGCSQSWFPAIRSDAATSSQGSLVSPGQPYAGATNVGGTAYDGRYTICASYDTNGAASGGVMYALMNNNQQNTNFGAYNTKNMVINSTTACL
jgi:prepilin-type N-terminal cleavage/methylation domain-containing protein